MTIENNLSELNQVEFLIKSTPWALRTKRNRYNFIVSLKNELAPNSDSLDFLNNYDFVTEYLLTKYDNSNTRKTKILDIRAVLNLMKDKKIIQKYNALADTLIEENNIVKGENIIDPNKYLKWTEIIKLPSIIEESIKFIYNKLFLSDNEIDELKSTKAKYKYLKHLTEYIVSVLYTYQEPIRADYAVTLLDHPYDNLNWYDSKTGIIHLNNFKNVKSLGKQEWKLNNNTISVLKKYIEILKYLIPQSTYLLYQLHNGNFKPFTREVFSTYFTKMNKKYLDKALNINSYRHSFETNFIDSPEFNKMTLNQKKDIHLKLLHSPATAQSYHLVEPVL